MAPVILLCVLGALPWATPAPPPGPPAPSAPPSAVPCGSRVCDVTYQYCDRDILGTRPVCSLCADICAYNRVGTIQLYVDHCLDVCPEYWSRQEERRLSTTARMDVPRQSTTQAPGSQRDSLKPNQTVVAACVGVVLTAVIVCGIMGYVMWRQRRRHHRRRLSDGLLQTRREVSSSDSGCGDSSGEVQLDTAQGEARYVNRQKCNRTNIECLRASNCDCSTPINMASCTEGSECAGIADRDVMALENDNPQQTEHPHHPHARTCIGEQSSVREQTAGSAANVRAFQQYPDRIANETNREKCLLSHHEQGRQETAECKPRGSSAATHDHRHPVQSNLAPTTNTARESAEVCDGHAKDRHRTLAKVRVGTQQQPHEQRDHRREELLQNQQHLQQDLEHQQTYSTSPQHQPNNLNYSRIVTNTGSGNFAPHQHAATWPNPDQMRLLPRQPEDDPHGLRCKWSLVPAQMGCIDETPRALDNDRANSEHRIDEEPLGASESHVRGNSEHRIDVGQVADNHPSQQPSEWHSSSDQTYMSSMLDDESEDHSDTEYSPNSDYENDNVHGLYNFLPD